METKKKNYTQNLRPVEVGGKTYVSLRKFAGLVGVNYMTAYKWARLGMPCVKPRGMLARYDVEACKAWLAEMFQRETRTQWRSRGYNKKEAK